MDAPAIRRATLAWIERVVIGLELCPFARQPVEAGRLRIAVTDTEDPRELLAIVDEELSRLLAEDPRELETSVLVHPRCLEDFEDFNGFFDSIEALLAVRELEGVIQVVGFHPEFRFADADPSVADDPANFTNRSPEPMLHLLREDSVARAVAAHPDPAAIPTRNAKLLRSLDQDELLELVDGE